ncbi:hypothetical protein GCM10023258_30320 [Terrabacter aeriphilus]|uniref:Uncharacterized protein n=1 Tax=Terrabacter aeriphilus TaxID=515662 RepID=A0ABP9JIW0_9MICO
MDLLGLSLARGRGRAGAAGQEWKQSALPLRNVHDSAGHTTVRKLLAVDRLAAFRKRNERDVDPDDGLECVGQQALDCLVALTDGRRCQSGTHRGPDMRVPTQTPLLWFEREQVAHHLGRSTLPPAATVE